MSEIVTAEEAAGMRERWWNNHSAECEASFSVRLSVRSLIDSHEQLRAELAAARERAEKAESAAAVWERRCAQATARSGEHLADLAVALRERDEWEEAAKEAGAACHLLREEHCARLESAEAELQQAFEDHQEVCGVVINLRTRLESAVGALRDIKRRYDIGRSGDETLSGPIRTNGFPVEAKNCWCNECVRGLVEAALGAVGEEQANG